MSKPMPPSVERKQIPRHVRIWDPLKINPREGSLLTPAALPLSSITAQATSAFPDCSSIRSLICNCLDTSSTENLSTVSNHKHYGF